jgi:hypothetical protein
VSKGSIETAKEIRKFGKNSTFRCSLLLDTRYRIKGGLKIIQGFLLQLVLLHTFNNIY